MIHLIANPLSRSGQDRRSVDALMTMLQQNGLACTLHLTEYPGHAAEIAAALPLTSEDHLVVIGGDGSLNDVINGLPLPCPCCVHLLPAGTGNDFARSLRLDRSPESLIRQLTDGAPAPVPMDLGCVTFRSSEGIVTKKNFAVSCGMGFDAAVCGKLLNSPIKKLCNLLGIGKLSYVIHGIQEIFCTSRKKRTSMTLVLDDSEPIRLKHVAFVSCHNTVYEGGGFPFAPQADPADGLLSVCAVCVPSRLLLIPVLLASLLGGRHPMLYPMVRTWHAQKIQIHAASPLWLHTDGECVPGICDAVLTALPGVLPLIYESQGH